jgi:predicted CxxxxCH...CXXCH cytochrome family protein
MAIRGSCWNLYCHTAIDQAEQGLRHAVIWRKLSLGTQSTAGSRFVKTMLSRIVISCSNNASSWTLFPPQWTLAKTDKYPFHSSSK